MDMLFFVISFLSVPVLIYFMLRMLMSKVKKAEDGKKNYKKQALITAGVMVVSFILFISLADTVEPEKVEVSGSTKEVADKVEKEPELTEEQKVAADLKAKEVAEAKAKTEAEKKEKKASIEKDYYSKEVSPQIDGSMASYDLIWSELWVPTFEGIADGSVDVYTAYENMKQLELRYGALNDQISNINGDKLSKDNKKQLTEFKSNLKDAALTRKSAGNEAKKMMDKGTFAPSEIDKVMSTVGYADAPMLSAVINKTALDVGFGLIKE
ncbi:hypothetical protein [Sporosarcina sp. FSL K6-5500]|uniref:hypothetical protein n=1 Tax=Sporosarcina sp. FSL K6-5500 TaxID=2921558 RepID=UPI0030FB73A4